jgi:hypothetical protein
MSYVPYGPLDDWLITPVLDLTVSGLNTARYQFNTYYWQYNYYVSYGYMKYRLDGGPWVTLDTFSGSGSGTTTIRGIQQYNLDFALGHTLQLAFHRYGTNQYNYYYWYVDDFLFEAIPELKHVYGMTPWLDAPTVTVANVFPSAVNEQAVVLQQNENTPLTFEGFEITDPAFGLPTEDIMYRWDFDDGTVTDWKAIRIKPATEYKVLVMQTLLLTGDGGPTYWYPLRDAILSDPMVTVLDNFNWIQNYQNLPTLEDMMEYNIIVITMNYAYNTNFGDYNGWVAARTELGNKLADYMDAGGGGVITQVGPYTQFGGDYWSMNTEPRQMS